MKKFTIKDFLDRKVVARCTSIKQKEAFLRVCAQYGLRWNAGYKADTFMPELDFIIMGENGRLFQSSVAHGAYAWFDQFVFPTTAPRYRIIIDCDGDTTTAKMIVNGKEVKTATAKRNPADKANWRIGAQTAFDRLWQRKEKQVEQKQKSGFKIGDRVVCKSTDERGRVVCFGKNTYGKDIIGVELDNGIPIGHQCKFHSYDKKPHAKSGHGYWFRPDRLFHKKHTKPEVREVKRRAKAGEYIKLVKIRYTFDELGQILRVDGYNPFQDNVYVCEKNHPYAHKEIRNMNWHYPDDFYVVLEGYKPEGE